MDNERHDVDMGNVSVPHFGVHLSRKDFDFSNTIVFDGRGVALKSTYSIGEG